MRSAEGRELRERSDQGVSSVQGAGRVPGVSRPAVSHVQGYGGVVRETAGERHDRHVEAIAWVLKRRFSWLTVSEDYWMRAAAECLDAAEVGF